MRSLIIAMLTLAATAGCSAKEPDRVAGEAAPAGPSAASTENSGKQAPDIRTIDWRNATLRGLDECGGGDIQFQNGETQTDGHFYRLLGDGARPAYGDLDGDGTEDAVLLLQCGPIDSSYGHYLVAVRGGRDLREVLGTVGTENFTVTYTGYRVEPGAIIATTDSEEGGTQERRYRWNGSGFE